MHKRRRFRPPYADTMEVFERQLEPAGSYFRNPGVARFVRAREPSLKLEREPQNPDDPNAIKVIGRGRGFLFAKRYLLGYLPRGVAKRVVEGGFWGRVEARLRVVEAGEYLCVEFDLLGPKGEKDAYLATSSG